MEILQGITILLDPWAYIYAAVGVTLGLFVGAIPGLTATATIAILLPITLQFEPIIALILMSAIYKGSLSAGSVPAILIGVPGTPAASATMIDGYPLAKKGKAGKAILVARLSSFIGDIIATIFLVLVIAQLAKLALLFGAAEYGALILFTFILISAVSSKGKDLEAFFKGLLATGLGMLVATVGTDPITGTERFQFGIIELMDGLNITQVLIGLYALSEVFYQLFVKRGKDELHIAKPKSKDDVRVTRSDFKAILPNTLKGSLIGTIIGGLPGLGATISAHISYNIGKSLSKRKSKGSEVKESNQDSETEFGNGNIKGIASAESANSAVGSSNLIPTLSLGIPGDAEAAILLSILIVYGITPGPLMFDTHGPLVYAFLIFLFVANIFVLLLSYPIAGILTKMVTIRASFLFPIIFGVCMMGVFGELKNSVDLLIMVIFGVIGFFLRAFRIPLESFVIGFILTVMMEEQIRRSLIYSDGSFSIFIERPISLFFIIASIVVLVFVFFGGKIQTLFKRGESIDKPTNL